ncbi:MAG: response regulator transcription factor [Bacteroidetes bacterium]|nr:response regulator transcription factor [Bacteroidota bacterium]
MTKILYIEDELSLGKIVKEALEKRSFEIEWIDHGSQVMASLEKYNPDLCILDVMLPGKDGFSLAQEIRSRHAHLPIIFLTAKSQTEDLVKGFESGGTDYIRKPFSIDELVVRINNQIKLRQLKSDQIDSKPEKIEFRSYTFFTLKYELHHHETVQRLSNRETQLLLLLSQHRNEPIDRKEILMSIWGDDSFFNSRNLDVYIRKLREYFYGDSEIQIITLKGRGYHFSV